MLPPLQQELDKLNGSTKSLEEAVQALQARIQEVGGLRLRAAKAKVDGLNESMQTKNQQLIQAQVQLKTASKVRWAPIRGTRLRLADWPTLTRTRDAAHTRAMPEPRRSPRRTKP